MDAAALLLGISRRFLVDVIKRYPHYEPRGSKKVFYPEHIRLLREALKCQNSDPNEGRKTASGTLLEPSTESVLEKVLRLATEKPPKGEVLSRSGRFQRVQRAAGTGRQR